MNKYTYKTPKKLLARFAKDKNRLYTKEIKLFQRDANDPNADWILVIEGTGGGYNLATLTHFKVFWNGSNEFARIYPSVWQRLQDNPEEPFVIDMGKRVYIENPIMREIIREAHDFVQSEEKGIKDDYRVRNLSILKRVVGTE